MPIASVPTLLEKYILKNIPVIWINRELPESKIPFNKKTLIFFKISPMEIYEKNLTNIS